MAAIKPIDQSAEKWVRRAGQAGPDYLNGVKNPRRPWSASAIAADPTYRVAVTAAANAGRYAGAVRRVGEQKWSENAVAKGPTRYPEGVQLATGEWQKGFNPYQSAIQALNLPNRAARGSAQNQQRSQLVGSTLNQVRNRLGGAAA
jgi:hypothetical protein